MVPTYFPSLHLTFPDSFPFSFFFFSDQKTSTFSFSLFDDGHRELLTPIASSHIVLCFDPFFSLRVIHSALAQVCTRPFISSFYFYCCALFFGLGLKKKLLCRLAYSLHSFSASYSNISFALRLKTLLSLHHFPLVLVYWFSLQNPPSCTRYE